MRREPSGRAGSVRWWWSVRKPRRPTRTRSWLGPPGSQGGIGDRTHAVQGPGSGLGSALATTSREMSGKQPCRRRLLLGNAYGAMSGGGGEVAPTGVGFPRQWYPGLGGVRRATACRVGRFFSGGLLWCSRVSSGGLVVGHTAFAPVSRVSRVSRVLWRHAGHLFVSLAARCWSSRRGGSEEHGSHAQRRACASPISHFSGRGDGWEEASHWGATGDPRGLLFSSTTVAWIPRGDRLGLSPHCSRCSSSAVDHLSPRRGSLLMRAGRDPGHGDGDGDGRGANGCLFFSTP